MKFEVIDSSYISLYTGKGHASPPAATASKLSRGLYVLVQLGRDSTRAWEGNRVLGNQIPGEDLSLSTPPELLLGVRKEARGCSR